MARVAPTAPPAPPGNGGNGNCAEQRAAGGHDRREADEGGKITSRGDDAPLRTADALVRDYFEDDPDTPRVESRWATRFSSLASHFVSKRPIGLARRGVVSHSSAADNPAHGRIARKPVPSSIPRERQQTGIGGGDGAVGSKTSRGASVSD